MNLDDINIKCEGDKVIVIAGAVGSGKVRLIRNKRLYANSVFNLKIFFHA